MAARLVERPPGAVLFRTPGAAHGDVVTAQTFLRAAHRIATGLGGPERGGAPVLNLCTDRCLVALAVAACILRGRPCVLAGADQPGGLAALAGRFPGASVVAQPGSLPAGIAGQEIALLPGDAVGPPPPNPTPPGDLLAAYALTSGSTGEPAAHAKTWGALARRSAAAGERFGLDDEARPATVVGTVPPHHMYGFETTVMLPLHAASSSWCGPAFYPADVRAALAAVPAPAVLVTTPLQMRALVEAGAPLPAFAAAISATAPLDPALAARAEQAWGAPVLEIYGATEAGSLASRRTVEGDAWLPYPGVAVIEEEGTALAVTEGAPAPQPLADRIEPLGGGRFRLLGRRADVVKLGGRRASLAGLTTILCSLDGVLDGAFAAPEDLERRASARLLAFAVAPGRTAESLLAELRGKVDPLFLPRRVIRVERLPRNGLGKLPREALLALAAEEGGRP